MNYCGYLGGHGIERLRNRYSILCMTEFMQKSSEETFGLDPFVQHDQLRVDWQLHPGARIVARPKGYIWNMDVVTWLRKDDLHVQAQWLPPN